ncbi:MAG: phenylacetate--CoA ligase family protein [Acidobacteriota bacterium]
MRGLGQQGGSSPRRAGVWGHLLYRPSLRQRRRHPVLDELERLEVEQWMNAAKVQAIQRARLMEIVRYALDHVPFYRRWREEAGNRSLRLPEDWHQLPILSRRVLAEQARSLQGDGSPPPGSRWNHTGGSTGQPVAFVQDDAYRVANLAAVARHDRWAGWDFGARTALIWGADRDLGAAQPWSERQKTRWLRRQMELDAFDLGRERMERFTARMARFRPQVIRGYASALELYAAYLEEKGRPFPPPRGVISCAETLSAAARKRLVRIFEAPVFDRYGSREFGLIASQCDAGGYHLNTRGVHVEILKESGIAGPGETGRVVVTGLACRAMPLIRYETGDIARASREGSCRCGRGLPLLGPVRGRACDFISTPDGRLIHGEFFTHLFYGKRCVRAFAVHQDVEGAVTLSVVGEGAALEGQLQDALAAVRRRLGASAAVEARRVDRIPIPVSGKRGFVRSDAAGSRWGLDQ